MILNNLFFSSNRKMKKAIVFLRGIRVDNNKKQGNFCGI